MAHPAKAGVAKFQAYLVRRSGRTLEKRLGLHRSFAPDRRCKVCDRPIWQLDCRSSEGALVALSRSHGPHLLLGSDPTLRSEQVFRLGSDPNFLIQ